MTSMGGVKNSLGGAGAGRMGARDGSASLAKFSEEEQRAHELIESLKQVNELEMLRRLLERADAGHGVKDPVTARSLKNIAALYESLGMPLHAAGVARFKQERGLVGGTITGAIARAYVRALEGREILVFVSKAEEGTLRPSEKACLSFLRELAKKSGAEALSTIKQHLALGNPPPSTDAAAELANEYVGLETVKDISQATTLRRVPLTKDGLRSLAETLAREAKAPKK